jgi:uncharacterized protein (TIGR04141 family)
MFADDDGTERLAGSSAIKWLETEVSIGARRYFLLDGQWYEIDAAYMQSHNARIISTMA